MALHPQELSSVTVNELHNSLSLHSCLSMKELQKRGRLTNGG